MAQRLTEWYQWVDQFSSIVLLDGGLGHILSERGNDISEEGLWSGCLLITGKHELRTVAQIWLEAGSDLIMTATYQVSIDQIRASYGLSELKAKNTFLSAVNMLCEVRTQFWSAQQALVRLKRRFPKIGASLGPLSAILPNLNEYNGSYDGVSYEEILRFHQERCKALESDEDSPRADIYCFETIGNAIESHAIVQVMSKRGRDFIPYWISFQCRNGSHIACGADISEVVRNLLRVCTRRNLVAVGVNCVFLDDTRELVAKVGEAVRSHMASLSDGGWRVDAVAYPNSGEIWSGGRFVWPQGLHRGNESWAAVVHSTGARIVGGCCRVGPEKIRALHARR